jgi:hypothetical protein
LPRLRSKSVGALPALPLAAHYGPPSLGAEAGGRAQAISHLQVPSTAAARRPCCWRLASCRNKTSLRLAHCLCQRPLGRDLLPPLLPLRCTHRKSAYRAARCVSFRKISALRRCTICACATLDGYAMRLRPTLLFADRWPCGAFSHSAMVCTKFFCTRVHFLFARTQLSMTTLVNTRK